MQMLTANKCDVERIRSAAVKNHDFQNAAECIKIVVKTRGG